MKIVKIILSILGLGIALGMIVFVVAMDRMWSAMANDEAFIIASAKGNVVEVNTWLNRGISANAMSHDGTPAIWEAAFYRQLPVVQCLLLHGAKPDAPGKFGDTALETAADDLGNDNGTALAKTDVAILNLLIAHGANVTPLKKDPKELTLLERSGVRIP